MDSNRLYELTIKHPNGFGHDLGNGYACFITKLISNEWMISKLNKDDKDVFRKIIPSAITENDFKSVLNDMLIAK